MTIVSNQLQRFCRHSSVSVTFQSPAQIRRRANFGATRAISCRTTHESAVNGWSGGETVLLEGAPYVCQCNFKA